VEAPLASTLSATERRFLEAVIHVVIPPAAIATTDVDALANIENMLAEASADDRANVIRLVRWCRRVSWLYGGARMPLQARRSRLVLMQKLAHALSALCLVAFWGDERALGIVDRPAATP
jgi:hypothetical protein